METPFLRQKTEVEHSQHIQTKQDNQPSSDLSQIVLIVEQPLGKQTGREAKRDEDDGKPSDEQQRIEK